ncbi:hypothetical protein P153DRAFT_357195 [Dothidotthia symphoricarpi CBS 119687]|uniref:Myb-like domain-containing protein n=1 Tax=Dothidotthia symphoricarpi CBS 119687 TaxID=1392245 RepID=A0A6A6ADM1_9PLEO|nr:uncharacterized protein P153DRAFT_357195 [Dothidotthia symphoricarpi CBS 119687]KAF2129656.1 hypothetical protein P153DRAFT_357195 [Dothidotthia symphoricarpi CBS 119687]
MSMADQSNHAKRVSMAYILGFSDKPFKEQRPPPPPQPPKPNAFADMVTTPGGVVEWVASDGRRGKLTGSGKPRLTADNLAKVPSAKQSVRAASAKAPSKAPSKKSASKKGDVVEDTGDMLGLFGALAPDAEKASVKSKKSSKSKKETPDSDGFTQEQDAKILDMKTNNAGISWAVIGEEIGKAGNACKDRFNTIKPKDWKPANVKGGGGKQKNKDKNQDKGKNQNQNQNQEDKEKKEEKKDEPSGGDAANAWNADTGENWVTDANATGGENTWEAAGDANNNTWGAGGDVSGGKGDWGAPGTSADANGTGNGGGWDGANDSGPGGGWGDTNIGGGDAATGDNGWNNKPDGGGDAGNSWDNSGNTGVAGDVWTTNADQNNNNGIAEANPWNAPPAVAVSEPKVPTPAPTIRTPSEKGSKKPSKNGSVHGSANAARAAPLEFEVKPNDTFSGDDLRLIAKILQQDSQMVWDRLSWRFRDKTGRTLHPEVFEEKITGRVEGKEREEKRRGERDEKKKR